MHGLQPIQRFMRYVEVPSDTADCWLWHGAFGDHGYGTFKMNTRESRTAHRASFELHNGVTVPRGIQVCHACDNRACVNPKHLWLGTHKENMEDCARKGRTGNHGRLDTVRAAAMLKAGAGLRETARYLGVSHTAISKAIKRGAI